MAYGQTPTSPLPAVTATLGPTYATMVNTAITELQGILAAKVTPSGMDISTDLSFRSGITYSGITNLRSLGLAAQSALLSASTYPVTLYSDSSGNLYFNNASGDQVQVTSGSSLAAAAGNIGGAGYGTGGVAIEWNAGDTRYDFFSAASTYASGAFDNVLLNDGSGNFITLQAPAMSADYSLTFPAALPANSNNMVQLSNVGALSASNAPTLSGLLTLQAGATASANQSFTVSGTGGFKHGDNTVTVPGMAFRSVVGTTTVTPGTDSTASLSDGVSTAQAIAELRIPAGRRIKSVVITLNNTGAGTRTLSLKHYAPSTGTNTSVASNTTTTTGVTTITLSSVNHTVLSTSVYYLLIASPGAGDVIRGVSVVFDYQ